jgi:RimJ/RimL family protein N-acetyltransferase
MIQGEKVVLRAIEEADTELCHRWMNDPEVTRFLGMGMPLTLAAERRWVTSDRDPLKDLVVMIQTLEGAPIGSCGLHSDHAQSRCAELGISIGEKEYWGQGYGADAVLTLCGFGFGQMNLHRIWLRVFDFNARGKRCYEKCGFQQEGRMREAVYKHGAYHDVHVMGLLDREYREKFPERWSRMCV